MKAVTTNPGQQVRVNFNVDRTLHVAFKAVMDRRGESMSNAFRRYMQTQVDADATDTSPDSLAGTVNPSPWDGTTPYALRGTSWRSPQDLAANRPWWMTDPDTDTSTPDTESDESL